MQFAQVQTAVCKSLQSLGLSPRKEHQIENTLVIQLRSSGAEFVLSRLSNLTDWRKMHMKGDTQYHPEWHAWKRRNGHNIPSDAIGSQLWSLSDRAFFATIGAISKAVELTIPSEKQLTKWIEAVRCENTSGTRRLPFEVNDRGLRALELKLMKKWINRPWFNVSDITGTNIPGSGKSMTISMEQDKFHKESSSLLSAYGFSISTAPLFTWQFLKDIDAPRLMSLSADDPAKLQSDLASLIDSKLKSYRLEDEAIAGSHWVSDEAILSDKGKFFDLQFGMSHSVGNIGFLEQGKGKLRTVANPNRFVQYVNIPLGEALSEFFYPFDGCYVLEQRGGIEWAQRKLRQGVSLSSFDMSSATDRLDYSKFLHESFHKVYEEPDRFPLLLRSLELFEDTSSGLWTIPGHIADLIGAHVPTVSWTVGQPLGLRPSFPILTAMNMSFARAAVIEVDGKYSDGHFACVGDDLIIEDRYASAYMSWVTNFNGSINNEKTMVSDRYAEFCSQMITKSTHYPLKPRYILNTEGSLQNIEKFSTSGLRPKTPKWIRDLHHRLSSYHLDGYDTISVSSSDSPRPLLQRLGVNALIKAVNPASKDPERISLQSIYLRALAALEQGATVSRVNDLGSSYASSAYPKFGGSDSRPTVSTKFGSIERNDPFFSESYTLGDVASDTSTSVEVPVKTEWDYSSSSYRRPASNLSFSKKLDKLIQKMKIEEQDNLVEVTSVNRGIMTKVLVDGTTPQPQVLIAHSMSDGPQAVQDISDDIPDKTASAFADRFSKQQNNSSDEEISPWNRRSRSDDLER